MPLLQKQRAAFPQPSRAIYCGKVIISLYLKKMAWMSPCLNVGYEPETTAAHGGAGSHFQSSVGDITECKTGARIFYCFYLLC